MASSPQQNVKKDDWIGPYKVIDLIGRGGMGEVYLAYDPSCSRRVALKQIRGDLKKTEIFFNRFSREVRITAQLTHPGIISIYSIHKEKDSIYYTMPYLEGETLKQILRKTHDEIRKGEKVNEIGGSIPALVRIFMTICEAVAYAHSKQILHRDLKPENILVGKYGEVIILDWGLAIPLAELKDEKMLELEEKNSHVDWSLTHPGKLVGTLAYMAPERLSQKNSSFQTDIYALGVILFQILTLRLPFHRATLKEFKNTVHLETIPDPEEVAPYRDVPPRLSRIVKRCLEADISKRYQTVQELLHDLNNYLEGKSEWFEAAKLNIFNKSDWQFQENVLISKHVALTRTTEAADWVSLMISSASFQGNVKIQTTVTLEEGSHGIGLLLSIPEAVEREHPHDGYCLWVGSEENPSAYLFRNSVEVMHLPTLFIPTGEPTTLFIEKIDNKILFSVGSQEPYSYISYLPLTGTHVGILLRDGNLLMSDLNVYLGNLNLQVSCLSVPDAFLSNKNYGRALAEYRRIGYSFPGHAEGREALFKAGVTLLEQAKTQAEDFKNTAFQMALDEFAKMHNTPGAPLEYLGKALVYETAQDFTEEVKCLELALRRYKKHPLISAIHEQILYRMHESSQKERFCAYNLILIALRLISHVLNYSDTSRLLNHLVNNWEVLPFLEDSYVFSINDLGNKEEQEKVRQQFSIPLAFWVGSPYVLMEIFQDCSKTPDKYLSAMGNTLFTLCELGSVPLAERLLKQISKDKISPEISQELLDIEKWLQPIFICHQQSLSNAVQQLSIIPFKDVGQREFRTIIYLIQMALKTTQEELVFVLCHLLEGCPISTEDRIQMDSYLIWAFLNQRKWKEAGDIFEKYSYELLNQETTLLHTLYGCWLHVTEGEEIANIHFNGIIDTAFPRSWTLLSHQLSNNLLDQPSWLRNSFMWERRQLYRQLTLYYHCTENTEKETYYRHLERQEYVYAE